MTEQPTTETRALAPAEQRQIHRVENLQPMLDSNRFEHFQRAASALMHSTILNPSIRGQTPQQCFSNLMLVFDLSDRWKLPALSIAQCITIVHDKVVYEGKLITAMLQATLGVTLHFHYTGERGTDAYRIYVSDRSWGDLTDEELAAVAPDRYPRGWRCIDGSVADWRTFQKNGTTPNPAWQGASQRNQLAYRGSREWTRLYEPAQLLGVYGDDELDTMTARMERARDITPAAPGLSGGFTRPAPDMRSLADVEDAKVEPIEAGDEKAADSAQEPAQDAQVDETAPDAAAKPADKPAAKRTAKQQKVVDDRAAALEKARAMETAAYDAARWGHPVENFENLLKPCTTDEERTYVENGFKRGVDELAAELQEAYDLGHAGTPIMQPDWLKAGDQTGERRWGLIKDSWQEGADAGTAEAQQDAQDGPDAVDADTDGEADDEAGDGALDAIAEAEPDLVETALQDQEDADFENPDEIDAFISLLTELPDWQNIKASLSALTKTATWTNAAPSRIALVRKAAWERQAELIEAGRDRLDLITDLTAFRCWAETTTDVDAINANWQALCRQPVYQALTPQQQGSLQNAIMGRVQIIQGKAG